MIVFRSGKIFLAEAEALRDRLTAVVNAALPYGWRFDVSPAPRREAPEFQDFLAFHLAGRFIDVEGEATLDCLDPCHTLEDQARAWQRNFRDELRRMISDTPARIVFWLTGESDQRVWYDTYFDQQLDVVDLEGSQPMVAADVLIHALQEGLERAQSGRLDYPRHHLAGKLADARVMGGIRIEDEEVSRPAGLNPGSVAPAQSYEYWIPFLMPGGAVRAAILRMRGRHVAASRLAEFPTLQAYRAAAAGALAWWAGMGPPPAGAR